MCYRTGKYTVCRCIFQPGNFTGWGSEGVNYFISKTSLLYRLSLICSLAFVDVKQKERTFVNYVSFIVKPVLNWTNVCSPEHFDEL